MNLNTIKVFFLSILILLIMIVPAAYPTVKLLILLLIFLANLGEFLLKGTLKFSPKLLIWVFVLVLTNLLILFIGTHDDINVFAQLLPSYVIWPILYTGTLVAAVSNIPKQHFHGVLLFSLISINVFIFYLILNYYSKLPNLFLLNLDIGMAVNSDGGYFSLFIPAITSLFFIGPYFVILSSMPESIFYQKYKLLIMVAIIMTLISSVIIGRRALLVLMLVSFLLGKVFNKSKNRVKLKFSKIIYLVIIFTIVLFIGNYMISYLNIDLRVATASKNGFFDFGIERQTQFNSLINGWKENVIFGRGYGVNTEYVRSDIPGTYELSYFALLFQGGIIGFSILIFLYLLIVKWLWKLSKINNENKENVLPLLGGYIIIMIANASNPYINSFDGLFFLFYPLAIINQHLVLKGRSEV